MTMQFLERALSKDETKAYMTCVYRDKNHLVATDGHRLHVCNGLPDATPGYLDGRVESFPCWQQVVPASSVPAFGLKDLKEFCRLVDKLVGLAKLASSDAPIFIDVSEPTVTLRVDEKGSDGSHYSAAIDITRYCYDIRGPRSVKLNGSYLFDAVKGLSQIGFYKCDVEITKDTAPVVIGVGEHAKAVIMPLRYK